MTSHGTGEGPRGFEAVQEPVSAPPKPSERAACRATPQGSVSAQRQYPKTGHGFAPQSINMRQGAFLARFPLWRLQRKISNWEKYQRCGVASDLPAASAFVFQVAPIAIGSLKSIKEPGHPLSRPRHLPNGYSFPGWGIL